MKRSNVRMNPTLNGNIHLGHVYVALVNWEEAQKSGGRFILRYDDSQEIWDLRMTPDEQTTIGRQVLKDLRMFGIEPDEVFSQRAREADVERIIQELNSGEITESKLVWSDNSPECTWSNTLYCAYNFPMTAEKVAFDFMSEITCLIRGEDLISEAGLYSYICERWRLPQPRQVYLPRMLDCNGQEISKTKGFPTVQQLSKTMSVPEMIDLLERACLKDVDGGWGFENIKREPMLPYDLSMAIQAGKETKSDLIAGVKQLNDGYK